MSLLIESVVSNQAPTIGTPRDTEAMSKAKKPAQAQEQPGPSAELHRALNKRKKSELVDVLIDLAQADRGALRQLTARFDVVTTPDELVAATVQAIADATAFVSATSTATGTSIGEAYGEVKRNLSRLDRIRTVGAGDATGAGPDEAGELPGRDERRGPDDRRHRELPKRGDRGGYDVRLTERGRGHVVLGHA